MKKPPILPRALPLIFAVITLAAPVRANVSVPALFSEHAVLQASERVPVWGKALPNEAVNVSLGKACAATKAGADGKWRVNLDLKAEGGGPFELKIQGDNQLVIPDILVGQVWVCSGQSNMEWPLRGTGGAADEIARSTNPQLRHFLVDRSFPAAPLEEVKGRWQVATPETTPGFSGVAYYFGQHLQRELQTPVGLINTSMGGTPVEGWTRAEAFNGTRDLEDGVQKALREAMEFQQFVDRYHAWQTHYGRTDRPAKPASEFNPFAGNSGGWTAVQMPDMLPRNGFPEAGAVWLCKKITLPQNAVGAGLEIFAGDIKHEIHVYWNGTQVGQGGVESVIHRYGVHSKYVTETEGVLALRIYSPSEGLGIRPGNSRFRLGYRGGSLQLQGEWLAKTEYTFPDLPANAEPFPKKPTPPKGANQLPGRLYNGMVHPLIPYAISGIIWYQGEQNWDRGRQYRISFPLMISDWRKQWGQGDFPFYFCQLANYQARAKEPGQSLWAEVRESQTSALKLPNTGQVVLIDVGDGANIHPADKRSPGERLANLALSKTYGKPHPESPVCESWKIEGNRVRVQFRNADGGLAAKPVSDPLPRPGSEVQGFAICGADHAWKWADAKIDGSAVLVSHPDIPDPVAVRYAWADNPLCNLINEAGLPTCPFRTDDFKVLSENARY